MKPGPLPLKPDRSLVLRIMAEEAKRGHCTVDDLLATGRPLGKVVRAKRRAMRRIIAETGCSVRGLADVWGISAGSVRVALGIKERAPPPAVLTATLSRLTWQYGPKRAGEIMSGRDPATEADIAAWQRLWDGGLRA